LSRTAQLDHILPRAKGGGDHISNLRWLCPEANYAKRDLTDEEFFALCGDVIIRIGRRIQEVENLLAI
jgi:5-methylcytosine-specific restriction endonuclease McrA